MSNAVLSSLHGLQPDPTSGLAPATSMRTPVPVTVAETVIDRLGRLPEHLPVADLGVSSPIRVEVTPQPAAHIEQVGVDVFLGGDAHPDDLAAELLPLAGDLRLAMISDRGQSVWPKGAPETLVTDHWRCRFLAPDGGTTTAARVVALLDRLVGAGLEPIKTEGLYTFDGEPGFSRGQGQ